MTDTTETTVETVETPATEPVVETTEPTVEEPKTEEADITLSEEELADIAKMFATTPTEPTFFPEDKKEEKGDDDNLTEAFKQIDALIESQVEKEKALKEKDDSVVQLTTDIENLKAELTDKSHYVETFQDFYTKLNEYIDSETIDAIGAGEKDKLPLHLIPENMKRVYDNPILGPLVQGLLKGEAIDIPKLIIETVKSKQASLPRVETTTTKPVDSAPKKNAMSDITRMNRSLNGLN